MLYIVTEDETSALDFWKVVAHVYKPQGDYRFIKNQHGGNRTLDSKLNMLLKITKKDDEILLIFDNITEVAGFSSNDLITKYLIKCRELGVKFRFIGYYCFEEVILSDDELIDMCDSGDKELITFINDCIRNRHDYYNSDNPIMVNYLNNLYNNGRKISTREKLANHIIVSITKKLKGNFIVSKKDSKCFSSGCGKCWLIGCNTVRSNI